MKNKPQSEEIQGVKVRESLRKMAWQRKMRREFVEAHGFSTASNHANGGLRDAVLKRDNYSCVRCGMTDKEHKERWNRPITVDHKDKNKKNNTMENLQTLCLRCHGKKDISSFLIVQKVPLHKQEILSLRNAGETYQNIADTLGFSIAAIWKWVKKWEGESYAR